MGEEMAELSAARSLAPGTGNGPQRHAGIEEEAGDLLFTAVNVARFLRVDPESALRRTNRKFRRRFQWMERELKKCGKSPRESALEEMETLWQQSKKAVDEHDG